jgi:hypothetical protein
MKNQFLFTTAALLAGMSLASAQGLSGAAGGEKGTSGDRSGSGISQSAPRASHDSVPGASHGEGKTQGRATESREGGSRAERPSARESGGEQRGERGRAEGARDSDNDQTIGQRKSGREDARQSQESGKERRGAKEDRADQQGNKDRTAGQERSGRDDARRSEESPGRENNQQAQQPSDRNPDRSGAHGQRAQDQKSNSTNGQSATQAGTSSQSQNTIAEQTQTRTQLTAQQQTTLQKSVLHADNAPRVNVNSINFQVHAGVAVPSNVSVVSVSRYPALIDVFPAYRDYSFFVVEDEVVFVDRDRHIVDVVPAGPRTRVSGGGHGSSSVATADLAPDDIRVIQRVLIERGLLHGEVDGVLGPQTREAITVYQREQGIQVTGSIDARTVSSLGVSDRLSQQAHQSISQSQSSTTDSSSQTSTKGQGQGQTGASQQPGQQSTAGQAPSQSPNQATKAPTQQSQPSTTTGQSTPSGQPNTDGNQTNTTGQAAPQAKGEKPAVNRDEPSAQKQGTGPSPGHSAPSNTSSK